MPGPYEFFEHTADIGVHIYGVTLQELFRNAALALYEVLGSLAKKEERKVKSLKLEAMSLEDLLHDWLADLLYEVEVRHLLYDEFEIAELTQKRIAATLRGGEIDFTRSRTNEEIKAVTYHQMRVEQLEDGTWRATVILDV
jgi:SHS2 domain-containing protein